MPQKPICILGMHRSGTSCLAGSLQDAGLYLGEVYTKNKHNLKGNREHIQLNALQDAVLEDNAGSWFEPPENVIWSDKHYGYLCTIISEFSSHSRWGFKDPRLLFTLSAFQDCLKDNIEFVGTFRNPFSVAKSLQARTPYVNNELFWLELWYKYNQRLLALWEKYHFPIINFDQNNDNYENNLNVLKQQLSLDTDSKTFSENFFNPNLRSNICTETNGLPNHVLQTYQNLQKISL